MTRTRKAAVVLAIAIAATVGAVVSATAGSRTPAQGSTASNSPATRALTPPDNHASGPVIDRPHDNHAD
ncbi:hypothetical protein LRS74_12945 [Streptomyces sp. LX-29]|uniref:hypothetical protein n=1 Tax=Streptomyces sp. LX-29 TaxID=2900152 RepID=UPI00240E6008|nr:hypothetical protein [Streptomyces sp. LX-29]WFB07851.1 hypothetical protein LRS74_12945 [Streptomyces sp. LX-29]